MKRRINMFEIGLGFLFVAFIAELIDIRIIPIAGLNSVAIAAMCCFFVYMVALILFDPAEDNADGKA